MPLLPPPLASPLLARVLTLGPAPLRMGELATLEIAFSLQPGTRLRHLRAVPYAEGGGAATPRTPALPPAGGDVPTGSPALATTATTTAASSRLPPASSPPTSPTSPPWRPRLNSVRGDFDGGRGSGGGGGSDGESEGGGGSDGGGDADAVELLLQASVAGHDWVMLGARHQRLVLLPPPAADSGGGAGGALEVVLRWRLLPLREGYLPLPLLAAWSVLGGVGGASAVVGEPLPPPAVIGGVSVHVLPVDA